jgi:hypothetical protein
MTKLQRIILIYFEVNESLRRNNLLRDEHITHISFDNLSNFLKKQKVRKALYQGKKFEIKN